MIVKMQILFLLFSIFSVTQSARILCVFTAPSISHQFVFDAITRELANRGHQLVIVTSDPFKESHKNITKIDIHDKMYTLINTLVKSSDQNIVNSKLSDEDRIDKKYKIFLHLSDTLLSIPEVKALIEDKNLQFDLVIAENLAPVMYAFAYRFQTPYIGISSLLSETRALEAIGNPTHPFLYTDPLGSGLIDLSIWNKFKILYEQVKLRYTIYKYKKQYDDVVRKHFGENVPKIVEMEGNVDLILSNTHPLLTGIRPLVPALITLGSAHLRPQKPLPRDLQEYLDSSKQGVVFFSLGSNAQSKNLTPDMLAAVLGALSRLRQRVLWKFEDDDLPNLPSNVRIQKWLPQQDVLGHPNVKAFVTQGGQQSMEEAIYNGVPMVAIPLLGDQDLNAQRMEHLGIAVRLEIWDLTEDNFYAAINKVLNDESYKKNVAKVRNIIHDEPMKPLDRAVWWIEYVLRHKGAQHLRAPAAGMPLWEYFMLDIIGVLATALVLTLSLLYYIFKFLRRSMWRTSAPSKRKLKAT